jgi:hypothetical protein
MNTKIIIAVLVAITASMFGATTLHSASAENAAVVIKDDGCDMLNQVGSVVVVATSDHSVLTSKGNTTLKCSATTPNDSGKALKFNKDNTGLQCYTALGFTDNWQQTISKSGQSTLSCFYKTV